MPMPTVQPIRSPKLLLRAFSKEDRAALSALQGDPQVMRYYGNGQALEPAQIGIVLDAHVHCREKSYWAWSITMPEHAAECIGQVTAGAVEWSGEQWIELCWLLVPRHWRKGFGTES